MQVNEIIFKNCKVQKLSCNYIYFFLLLVSAEAILLIDGPRDQGVQVKSNATFFCKVYDTNSTGPDEWEPFMISWTFQPLVGTQETIMEVEIHKMEFILHANSNANKYSTSNGYELHINSVNFSDAGNYTCTLNVSQEMAKASLSVLGELFLFIYLPIYCIYLLIYSNY